MMLRDGQNWDVVQADCLDFLRGLPAGSVDLVFGSPPYEKARLYLENGEDKGIARDTETWVAWMVEVVKESLRVCKGLVAFVVEGQTRQYRYSAGPALLMADLHRAGVHLRKPPIFHRVGIPGSGGPDWLRNDWEWIICATNGGKLPWSDNTALGHIPKWAPGGEMSHRQANGARRNKWGKSPMQVAGTSGNRNKNGTRDSMVRAGDDECRPVKLTREEKLAMGAKAHTKRDAGEQPNGDAMREQAYLPPAIANPGNVLHYVVGGGLIGSDLAHENEAPFPEDLAEFFVLSFCPPGGIVMDPFSGSGTTAAVAVRHGRRALACDVRESQVKLSKKRIAQETPLGMFTE